MVSHWWRRATALAKDKQSLCLTRVAGRGGLCNTDMESAVIRATSHDESSLDYKNARRVFTWARTSPDSFLHPLMWSIARRASRTKCWAVALKSLLLAHGLLLQSASEVAPGRLPFDLSAFRDRSSRYWGHSAFVQAYFNFLDHRSLFLVNSTVDDDLESVERMQALLGLLMQIRPYADGMEAGLVREAMDCVLIEVFEVYSGICNGIASFLVGYMEGGGPSEVGDDENRQRGLLGIQIVRRASEQSEQLSAFFELCQRLRVPNAAGLPPVERIPEEDILNLEKVVMNGMPKSCKLEEEEQAGATVTENWVLFDDGGEAKEGKQGCWNTLECSPSQTWASIVQHRDAAGHEIGDLIEL